MISLVKTRDLINLFRLIPPEDLHRETLCLFWGCISLLLSQGLLKKITEKILRNTFVGSIMVENDGFSYNWFNSCNFFFIFQTIVENCISAFKIGIQVNLKCENTSFVVVPTEIPVFVRFKKSPSCVLGKTETFVYPYEWTNSIYLRTAWNPHTFIPKAKRTHSMNVLYRQRFFHYSPNAFCQYGLQRKHLTMLPENVARTSERITVTFWVLILNAVIPNWFSYFDSVSAVPTSH